MLHTHVLFSTKCHSCHNFTLFCAKIYITTLVGYRLTILLFHTEYICVFCMDLRTVITSVCNAKWLVFTVKILFTVWLELNQYNSKQPQICDQTTKLPWPPKCVLNGQSSHFIMHWHGIRSLAMSANIIFTHTHLYNKFLFRNVYLTSTFCINSYMKFHH